MKKSRTSSHLKEVPEAPMVSVQVPLPMLVSLQLAQQSFLDLCILAGQEVLTRGMEEDRTALCGEKGQHDKERQATRWGKSSSEVTLVDHLILGEPPRDTSLRNNSSPIGAVKRLCSSSSPSLALHRQRRTRLRVGRRHPPRVSASD